MQALEMDWLTHFLDQEGLGGVFSDLILSSIYAHQLDEATLQALSWTGHQARRLVFWQTCKAKSGTGSQDGRPSTVPSDAQSSAILTGFGAVALYTPLNCVFWMASTKRLTKSSLQCPVEYQPLRCPDQTELK